MEICWPHGSASICAIEIPYPMHHRWLGNRQFCPAFTQCRFNPTIEDASNHSDLTCFVTIQTSSDTEVVGDLLWTVFDGQLGEEIPQHITTTAKSVLNLYLYAQFCMILTYRNHIRTVADRGKHKPQISSWVLLQTLAISGS